MDQRVLDLDDFIVQRTISEFPKVVKSVISNIIDDLNSGATMDKATADDGHNHIEGINSIPSIYKGQCYPGLICKCYDKDNFEKRLLECLDHASITCAGRNREIFFISTQWYSHITYKHMGYIEALRRDGISINMIYITKRGLVLMPV